MEQEKENKKVPNVLSLANFWTEASLIKFFSKHSKLILLIVVLLFVYISNHYSVIMKLAEINRLQQELNDAKYEALMYSSEFMQESRQSHIKSMVEEKGLELKELTEPPYTLKVK
jgi:cell division protein FtsL